MEAKRFETILRPGFRREYEINIFEDSVHYGTVIDGLKKEMEDIIREARHEFQALTILSHMCAEFRRTNEDGSDDFQPMFFVIPRIFLMLPNSISDVVTNIVSSLKQKVEEFEQRGSSWIFSKMVFLKLIISKYSPLTGSTYFPTPKKLAKKKAVINVRNSDNRCFLWAMMSGLHPVNKDPQRCPRYYTFVDELNMDGVEYPVKLDGRVFKKIRDNNPGSPFNVFIYSTSGEKEEVLPFSLHSDPNVPNVVDLLYI